MASQAVLPCGSQRIGLMLAAVGPAKHPFDVTLWLSAWGGHQGRLAELETKWTRLLERLFPEGVTP